MMASRLSRLLARLSVAVFLLALAAPQLGIPTVQAKDGSGLDRITWSGTIRVEMQGHRTSNSGTGRVSTETENTNQVTVYQLEGLPHSAGDQWSGSDVRMQVRYHEDAVGSEVSRNENDHSQGSEDGSGNTTGSVSLWIRGEGKLYRDKCRIEAGILSSTKNIPTAKTIHYWGVDEGKSYDFTNNSSPGRSALDARLDFPCEIGAHSLSGTQETEHYDDVIERVTWDLHQDGDPQTEVELIPPGEYAQWLPQADDNEKTIGNFIDVEIVAHTKGDPTLRPPKRVLKYTITLQDTSKEKGVDLNWPSQYANGGPTEDYDFKIDETNPWIKITDDKGQSAETKEEDLTDFWVTLNSYDWGGWTHLKVVAELSDHTTVVAHVQSHPDQEALAVPKDDNLNHIADAWEDCYDLASKDAAADDDNVPVGDGTNGDNVALYDEYRGFHIGKDNHHERLSPVYKDLFIVDYDQLGAGIYQKSTGVHVHLLTPQQTAISDQNAAAHQAANYVTVNGHYGRAYAIALRNTHIGTWGVGSTEPGVGVPAAIQVVQIDAAVIAFGYKDDAPAELQATIAHELGHATNVYHHGETEYNVGDVVCKNAVTHPDGSVTLTGDVTNHTCSGKLPMQGWVLNNGVPRLTGAKDNCWVVAGKGGEFSGNDQCPMRYDMANYYEDPNGLCRALKGGHGVLLSDYGQDHPGMGVFCSDKKGTGVNDPANPHNKAGDATLGRCAAQIRLK